MTNVRLAELQQGEYLGTVWLEEHEYLLVRLQKARKVMALSREPDGGYAMVRDELAARVLQAAQAREAFNLPRSALAG